MLCKLQRTQAIRHGWTSHCQHRGRTSQTLPNELGWWTVRHLALDYFAGLGGTLGLRGIETAEYFPTERRPQATDKHGTHVAQLLYPDLADPQRITVAIIESLLRGIPWEQYHAKLWPVRRDPITGPMILRVQCMGPVSIDSQYDQNKVTLRCGSYMIGGATGMEQILKQRGWLHGISEQVGA